MVATPPICIKKEPSPSKQTTFIFFFNLEIEVEIRFQIINQFFMKRKISTPFLSGDFFSNIADYVIDSEDFETLRAMTSKVEGMQKVNRFL